MGKVYLTALSVLLLGSLGAGGYVFTQYSSVKDALVGCEERLESKDQTLQAAEQALVACEEAADRQQKELASELTASQDLREQLARANEQHETAFRQMADLEGRVASYQEEKTVSDAEAEELMNRLAEARNRHEEASTKVDELTRKIAEFEEQQARYEGLIAGLNQEIQAKEVTITQYQEKLEIQMVNQILFGDGSTRITPQGQQILARVGLALENLHDNYVFVIGHTDSVPIGPDFLSVFPSNWELSAARSAAVVRYLVEEAGVDPRICVVVGRSFHSPLGCNESPEGRSQNRRAEIIIAKTLNMAASEMDIPLEDSSGGSGSFLKEDG